MPLVSGNTQHAISSNIKELTTSKPSKTRAKGIKTLAKRRGLSYKAAKQKQAIAISYSKARKSLGSRPAYARVNS